VGDEVGAWPRLPPGAFRDVDLSAGLIAGVVLLVLLLAPAREHPVSSTGHRTPDPRYLG
jgi:hypothetical protein